MVVCSQRVVSQAKVLHAPGPAVLYNDLTLRGQFAEYFRPIRLTKVQRHALLLTVQVQEEAALFWMGIAAGERAASSGRVPGAGPLHLDYLGPAVCQHLGAVRPRDVRGDIENSDSLQGKKGQTTTSGSSEDWANFVRTAVRLSTG